MVAICTGPAFATDDAGNLILAGERRLANPSPCALKDANGLYTDPSGGVWTPDQLAVPVFQELNVNPSATVPGNSTVITAASVRFTVTNPNCWAVVMNLNATINIWADILVGGDMVMETQVSVGTGTPWWWTVASANYYPQAGAPGLWRWFPSTFRPIQPFRLESHGSTYIDMQVRVTGNGAGGTFNAVAHLLTGCGYTVI